MRKLSWYLEATFSVFSVKENFQKIRRRKKNKKIKNVKIIISNFPVFSLKIKNGKTDTIPSNQGEEGSSGEASPESTSRIEKVKGKGKEGVKVQGTEEGKGAQESVKVCGESKQEFLEQ
jgi:hypothetical protein